MDLLPLVPDELTEAYSHFSKADKDVEVTARVIKQFAESIFALHQIEVLRSELETVDSLQLAEDLEEYYLRRLINYKPSTWSGSLTNRLYEDASLFALQWALTTAIPYIKKELDQ